MSQSEPAPIERSRLSVLDQLEQSWRAFTAQRRRVISATGSIAVGVAALLTVVVISSSGAAALQIAFDRLRPDEVTATLAEGADGDLRPTTWDGNVDERLLGIKGVKAGGTYLRRREEAVASRISPAATGFIPTVRARTFEASAGAMLVTTGSIPAGWNSATPQALVAIGRGIAARIGVEGPGEVIFVDGHGFTVAAVIDAATTRPEILEGLTFQPGALGEAPEPPTLLVETRPGWATYVAEQIPAVLLAGHPDLVRTVVPPEPTTLRDAVSVGTRRLLLSIGVIALFNGVVAVSGAMAASVAERTAELSLRRVLGARSQHLQRLVLTEAMMIGGLGGFVGTVAGVPIAAGVCLWRGWAPSLTVAAVAAFLSLGVATGAVAGVLPAWRAGRIVAADGLRRE